MKFYIVGSTLTKESPRDIDIMGVVSDEKFEALFDMTATEFVETGKTGNWPDGRWKWARYCITISRTLLGFISITAPCGLDFKILPRSLLRVPFKEIGIKKQESIVLPNGEREVK